MCSNIVNTTRQWFSYGLAWAKTDFSPWETTALHSDYRTYSMHHWGCCYLQLWATNEDLSVHSRLPPNAGLASDLKGSLLLRSSFSTSVHLLPVPPGTEHRLETCSYGSKITEERWPSLHWTVKIYGGFHRLLWRQEGQWKAISRRKSPRGLAPLRAFPVEYFGSLQVLPAFWKLAADAQAVLNAPVSTVFLPNILPKRKLPSGVARIPYRLWGSRSQGAESVQRHWLLFWKLFQSTNSR